MSTKLQFSILTLFIVSALSSTQSLQANNAPTTTIPLNNINGQVYSGEIQIGMPPQNFQVLFDIGYSDIVVTSSFCTSCSEENKYNTSASNASIYLDRSFDISGYPLFSSSPIDVESYIDKVTIGDDVVSVVQFFVANGIYDLEQMNVDGLFGLGLQRNISIGNFVPPLQLLQQQQLLSQSMFSIYLSPAVNQPGSFLMLGGYDTTIAPNGFNYFNLSAQNTWQITIDDFGLGNKSYNPSGNSLQGVLFTSLPYIYGSSDLMSGILSEFNNQISCSDINSYPNLYFTIGGNKYEIPPSIYMLDQGYPSEGTCTPALNGDADFSVSVPEGQIYIGTVFFRNYYALFDIANQRIGLATPVLTSSTSKTPLGTGSLFGKVSAFVCFLVSLVYMLL